MSLAPKGAADYPRKGKRERGSDIARSQRIHEIGSAHARGGASSPPRPAAAPRGCGTPIAPPNWPSFRRRYSSSERRPEGHIGPPTGHPRRNRAEQGDQTAREARLREGNLGRGRRGEDSETPPRNRRESPRFPDASTASFGTCPWATRWRPLRFRSGIVRMGGARLERAISCL